LFNLSGHGHFDMTAYQEYFDGCLQDVTYEETALMKALAALPRVAS
jgi:tryptophan synthase beta chain